MASIADLVHQTSTSTGTGNLTLSSVNGKQTFNGAFGNGATTNVFYYFISNQGAAEYEIGTGHMSDATTLVRDTVIASSNSNAAVNFTAGTKDVSCDLPATYQSAIIPGVRERLSADRTYYVRTDGSDSNTGLSNSSGGAFLTLQKAVNVATDTLDLAGFTVTVQVVSGTYSAGISMTRQVIGGVLKISGDTTTPSNVVVSTAGSAIDVVRGGCSLSVEGLKVVSSGAHGLNAEYGGKITLTGKMDFGACGAAHMHSGYGSLVQANTSYNITGGAVHHLWAETFGSAIQAIGGTITLTGTPAFSGAFATATLGAGIVALSATYSGSATGKRYDATVNGVVATFGSGATYFPGNSAGTTASGGQAT